MSRNYAKQPLKIFIAVGHGGSDPGAVYGNYREAEFNRTVASLMKQDLQRHGVQVLLSQMCIRDRFHTHTPPDFK